MMNNKVITENEFMQKEKLQLLQTVATLKRLKGHDDLIADLVERAKGKPEDMLKGLSEELTRLQQGYREGSLGHTLVQERIDELEGDVTHGC